MIIKQTALRPQDAVALLKIVSLRRQGLSWLKKDLAEGLDLANSEITNVFDRLKNTGLFDVHRSIVQPSALYEFLIYGLKAAFPPFVGPETRGVLTGANAFPQRNIKGRDYVWETFDGNHRGALLSPLYPGAIPASKKDEQLYLALCACDMLRIGQTREIAFAREWLKNFIFE